MFTLRNSAFRKGMILRTTIVLEPFVVPNREDDGGRGSGKVSPLWKRG